MADYKNGTGEPEVINNIHTNYTVFNALGGASGKQKEAFQANVAYLKTALAEVGCTDCLMQIQTKSFVCDPSFGIHMELKSSSIYWSMYRSLEFCGQTLLLFEFALPHSCHCQLL